MAGSGRSTGAAGFLVQPGRGEPGQPSRMGSGRRGSGRREALGALLRQGRILLGGHVLDVMNTSFCEVAVDPETGAVEVTKYVAVCDVGKVLRMTSFEGQLHQAMFELPDPSQPAGTVAQVVQPGYMIGDRLLRAAMVAVAKGEPARPATPPGAAFDGMA